MKIDSLVRSCALTLAAVCLGSFVWGMIWHFRRTGKPSRAMLVTALLGVASALLQLLAIERRPPRFPVAVFSLYGMSAALFWWGVSVTRGKLAACGQGRVSERIVKAGPYRYIRHPFYTSYNLTWIAGFAATEWWPLAVSAIFMACLYERAAREEEAGFAASPLAVEYAGYRKHTGKYLPGIRM